MGKVFSVCGINECLVGGNRVADQHNIVNGRSIDVVIIDEFYFRRIFDSVNKLSMFVIMLPQRVHYIYYK